MKKLKFLVGAVALFALVVVNVWNAATTLRGSELGIVDVEAMANPEGMGGSGAIPGKSWKPTDSVRPLGSTQTNEPDGGYSTSKSTEYSAICVLQENGPSNCRLGAPGYIQETTHSFYDNTGHLTRTVFEYSDPDGYHSFSIGH